MNETIPSQNTLAAVDTNNNNKPIISTDAEGIISGGNTSSNTLSPQLCEEDIQTSSSPSSSSPSSKKNRMMLKKNSSCNRSRRKIAMMEQREALSAIKPEGGGAAAARPGLGARSNTIGTTKFLRFLEHENNEEEEEDKSSSSFSRDILLDNHRKSNMSMPSLLGVSSTKPTEAAAAATSTTTKSSLFLFPQQHHCRQVQNLSFADAKKIWMREWRTSQQEQQRRQYSFSSFDDDLEKSLRQAPSLRSIDTLVSSTVSDSHNSHTMTGHGSSRTAVTMVLEGEEQEQTVVQPIITKHVRFSTITIQEYPIIPGCHPGGSSGGIPITIDWIPYDAVSIPLESYEKWRVPHLREKGEMRIPSKHREMMLRSLGFAPKVLQAAAKEAAVVRKQRSKSNSMERMDKTSEQLEATIRGIQNFLTLGKKKRKERAFLARHVPSYDNATAAAAATTGKAGSNTGNSTNSRRASTPVLPTSRPPKSFMDSSRRASTPPEVKF